MIPQDCNRKIQQVSILLGRKPNSECFLNSPTASSRKAHASLKAAPEYATAFLLTGLTDLTKALQVNPIGKFFTR